MPNRPGSDQIENPRAEVNSLFERDAAAKAYDLLVLERARELVRAKIKGDTELPGQTRLDWFLEGPDEDVIHRVEGLWPSGGRVVLSAQNKSGKTTMVANLLRSLVDGEPFLGRFAVEPVDKVVLIDNELDERMLRRWLREQGIKRTEAIWVIPLRGQLSTFNILDPATRDLWAAFLDDPDVVIFDCLRPALDALGLSEDKDAGRFLEALDELTTAAGVGVESIVVHHMGHSGERSRGDSRILDWPDAVWKLVRDAEDEDDPQAPSRRYFTAYGRDVDQPEVLLAFESDTRRLTVAGGSRQDTRADHLIDDICTYLEEHPNSSKNAIEKGVEGRAADVRKSLARAVEKGLVMVFREGTAHRHTLTSSTSSHLVPDERTNLSSDLVPSSIDEGRGRGTPGEQPQLNLVPDEPTCVVCGEPLDGAAKLADTETCTSCETKQVVAR